MIREILHQLDQAIKKQNKEVSLQECEFGWDSVEARHAYGKLSGLVEAVYIVKEYEREED